jgi:hypothetical protein
VDAALQRLQRQVAALKASREKLLEQVDAQFAEMERLGNENAALAAVRRALTHARACAHTPAGPPTPAPHTHATPSNRFSWLSISGPARPWQRGVVLERTRGGRACRRRLVVFQGLDDAREAISAWESQAQEGLAQSARLKDLLEESATWSISKVGPGAVPTLGLGFRVWVPRSGSWWPALAGKACRVTAANGGGGPSAGRCHGRQQREAVAETPSARRRVPGRLRSAALPRRARSETTPATPAGDGGGAVCRGGRQRGRSPARDLRAHGGGAAAGAGQGRRLGRAGGALGTRW